MQIHNEIHVCCASQVTCSQKGRSTVINPSETQSPAVCAGHKLERAIFVKNTATMKMLSFTPPSSASRFRVKSSTHAYSWSPQLYTGWILDHLVQSLFEKIMPISSCSSKLAFLLKCIVWLLLLSSGRMWSHHDLGFGIQFGIKTLDVDIMSKVATIELLDMFGKHVPACMRDPETVRTIPRGLAFGDHGMPARVLMHRLGTSHTCWMMIMSWFPFIKWVPGQSRVLY